MTAVVADTHALVWYFQRSRRLSEPARDALLAATRDGGIVISAISLVELVYLTERERLPQDAVRRLDAMLDSEASPFAVVPLDRAIVQALAGIEARQVPEMPDRIIAATAVALRLPLVTADARLRASGVPTIW